MKALLRLWPYLKPHVGILIVSLLLAIPLSALRVSPAPLIKYMTDDLLVNKDASRLIYFPLITIAIYVGNFFVRFLHYYLINLAIGRLNLQFKQDLFKHILSLSADYFSAQRVGALTSRITTDPTIVYQGVLAFPTLIREPVTFAFLLGYAFYLNWRLAILTLAILPPLAWVFSASGRNLKRYIKQLSEEDARSAATLQEAFSGVRVVKLFGLEKYVRASFGESMKKFFRVFIKASVLEEAAHPLVELMLFSLIAAMIYTGGSQILEGKMTSGDLFAFFTTFALIINPIRTLNEANIKIHQAAGAAERIFELFDLKSKVLDPRIQSPLQGLEKAIEFKNISFAYPDSPGRPILKNVSFTLQRGQRLLSLAQAAQGKSSLASLLPRIFDVTEGSILWDGVDLREMSSAELRDQIAVVSQDVFLFNDTIEENIRCGRLDAKNEEIREAARLAHAMEFIERFPSKMKTIVGDRGQKLSGGEKQRISIARAFLRQAPVLVLDEATSNLDTASERVVQEAISELMNNRTTLVIAHRLSTVQNADEIIVLKNGQIVERGQHSELVEQDGEYSRFHALGLEGL